MNRTDILTSALISAAVALLVQLAAVLQTKTTGRVTQPRPATRHVDPAPNPRPASRDHEEYPGRLVRPYADYIGTQTAGAQKLPQEPPCAPAPYTASHAADPSGLWTSPTWPPLTATADTHVTEAIT